MDRDLCRWAADRGRVVVSYNVKDFVALVTLFFHEGLHHPGLIVIKAETIAQQDIGTQIRALERLLLDDPDLTDQFVFLGRR